MVQYSPELLSIEEFARRMGMSSTTVKDWKKKGWLKPGRHYTQIGRKVWFEWGPELIGKLAEDSAQRAALDEVRAEIKPVAKTITPRIMNKKSTALNWDC